MTELLIGIDSGTSVVKAVAFTLSGVQLAVFAVPNSYQTGADGAATQSLHQTWADCATALRGLAEKLPNLAARTAAVSVTAQGDGTWLAGPGNRPVGDAWLWLDARAAPTVDRLAATAADDQIGAFKAVLRACMRRKCAPSKACRPSSVV